MAQISKFDINPATGRQYGINPATGVQDDNYWAQVVEPGLKSMGYNIPGFTFDYGQAEAEAREKLRPYYEQKLRDAQGDVERAKRLIEEDYAIGKRYAQEDTTTELAADTQLAKQETQVATEGLNKRGLLFGEIPTAGQSAAPYSQFAQMSELNPLAEKQSQRKMAIERALARQEEVAGLTRKRGIEEQNIQFPRQEQAILEEKEQKVQEQFVPQAYERARARYDATYGESQRQAVERPVETMNYLKELGWA